MYDLIRRAMIPLFLPIIALKNRILMGRWKKYSELYLDQWSLLTLEARAKYVPWQDYYMLSERILEMQEGNKKWHLSGEINNVKQLVVYGKGKWYEYTRSLLLKSDFEGAYRFIGDNKELIYSVNDNESLLIAYGRYRRERSVRQIKKKHPDVNVLDNAFIYGTIGNQYFDVFPPAQDEVIIDAGVFDGETEKQFFAWGKEKIKKIYAFELDPRNAEKCLETYKQNGYHNVEFINKGVGNENGIIHLAVENENSPSSKIGKGPRKAEVCRIDDEVSDKITLIKMDIEGEELNALKGAERTIKENKPRLAICIYHKASDMYKIPRYLHEIVPEYRFVVRHYTSTDWETVLYAWV